MSVGPGKQNGGVAVARQDRLADLPDEVLLRIFETAGRLSKRALCNVSRLNKRYHVLADSILYNTIQFDTPEHHLIFSQSLGRRPRRGSLIVGVRLAYPTSELSHLSLDVPVHGSHYEPSRFDGLSRSLSTMSNLEMLDVAAPDTLLHGIGTIFNGPFDFACLKSCTLFYQCPDDQYWDLRENIHIFSHPALETLVVKRAKLADPGFDYLERPHDTALKKLHLIECDINEDALSDILEFPEALTEFIMTQTAEPKPELEEGSDDVGDFILALKSACESLETITIDCPALTGRKALRMREFTALKTLRLNWDYQLFGKSSKKPRMHSVGLPPELETLEFFNELGTDEEVNDLLLFTVQSMGIIGRKLKTLVVVEGEDRPISEELIEACKSQDFSLDIIGRFDEE
ncbi:hypothetical protein JX265_012905 [Neoarthrinium moseri]|uniref:F-box domain-containing protein n=1 Tax=Neoarthrinium moseri TaxID=1658444 RepID=A0A9P9W9F2_9PEZI|nr:uncharacterized protein JN550_002813 [Neoarthrinium moseri]KAI1847092.1 hypothetical protein JX266_006967 [Neoarthrinium moseri]KAI1852877.1 hypothetical protein JX265_012905 [Neoarthrinium moseri]KAI1874234.1 hypothetical protein JN550_002813 [Neoarthrinium moseri]